MGTYQMEIHSNAILCISDEGVMLAEVTFPAEDDNVVNIDHTFVDESLRGQGVAGKMLAQLAQELEETGRKARPTCSYAVSWFEKHPERADLLA